MAIFRLSFRSCLFLLLGLLSAHAHIPDFGPLVIPLGETRTFRISADLDDEPAPSKYRYVSSTVPGIAEVVSPRSFSKPKFGEWTILGTAIGSTVLKFHWFYKDAKHFGDEDETITVQVVEPGGTSGENGNHLTGGDPANTRNGEFFQSERSDLNLGGPLALYFRRYYSSHLVAAGIPTTSLGANRLHNFDWKLTVELTDRRVRVVTDKGRILRFERRGGSAQWTQIGRVDVAFELIGNADDGYTLATPGSQRIWTFDNTGRLTTIEDGRGNALALTYTGSNLTSVADGLGRSLVFTYVSNRITQVADHTGRHVDFTYSGNNLATSKSPLSFTTTYTYDGAGLLISVTQPEGNTPFTQTFASGKVSSQTEFGTDVTSFAYGSGSTTVTQPGGQTMTHHYSPTGEITMLQDEAGGSLEIGSDATGRRNSIFDREGDATRIVYHEKCGLPAVITNAEGKNTILTYKSRTLRGHHFFDCVKVVRPDNTSESFAYDALGNLVKKTDRAGKKWAFTYNNRGQCLTKTNPLGGVDTWTFDSAGNLQSSKDSGTGTTTYTYDTLNRIASITRPGGATVLFNFDANDRLLTRTDERSHSVACLYDTNDRLTSVLDPNSNTVQFAYDLLNRLISVTNRLNKTSTRTFDARHLLASFTDLNGNSTTITHDARQRPTAITDAASNIWNLAFDSESLLSSSTDPLNPPSKIKRNALGRPTEVANPLGHRIRYVRDAMQRVIEFFDALGRSRVLKYDQRGLLVGASDQSGATATYVRDALGHVTQVKAPNGGMWNFAYTVEGRLSSRTDPLGARWEHSYDDRGRLDHTAFPDGDTMDVTYDATNNVTRRLFAPNGPDLNYTHDNLGRVLTASDTNTPNSAVILTYDAEGRPINSQQAGIPFAATYDDGGRLKTASYNNGAVVVSYSYDTRNNLTQVTDSVSGATHLFTYDAAGRRTAITRGNGVNSAFTYDAANRLTRIQHGSGVVDLKYVLNAAGEITSIDYTAPTNPQVTVGEVTHQFGKASQIIDEGFTYDQRGCLTQSPTRTCEWDAAERLVECNNVELDYNAFGETICRTEGGVATRFFHHPALGGSPIVGERNESNSTFTRYYVYTPGGGLLYLIDPANANAPTYCHFDEQGSTVMLTNSGGSVTDSYHYGPLCESLTHDGNSNQPFTYGGEHGVRQEGDTLQISGLTFFDPGTKCSFSRNEQCQDLTDVQTLNPYTCPERLRVIPEDAPVGSLPYSTLVHLNPDEEYGSNFKAALNVSDTGRISGFTLIEGGCDLAEFEGEQGGCVCPQNSSHNFYASPNHHRNEAEDNARWPNVMVQILDLDGFRSTVGGEPSNRNEAKIEHMHINGSGGPAICSFEPISDALEENLKPEGGSHSTGARVFLDQFDDPCSDADPVFETESFPWIVPDHTTDPGRLYESAVTPVSVVTNAEGSK